jgi:hypothetical protein
MTGIALAAGGVAPAAGDPFPGTGFGSAVPTDGAGLLDVGDADRPEPEQAATTSSEATARRPQRPPRP